MHVERIEDQDSEGKKDGGRTNSLLFALFIRYVTNTFTLSVPVSHKRRHLHNKQRLNNQHHCGICPALPLCMSVCAIPLLHAHVLYINNMGTAPSV